MSIRILYVDDEPDIREIACLSLSLDPSVEVRACESGIEAIAEAQSWRPHLILLDVMMPGLDGPGTLKALRNTPAAAIPVVFITARTQASEVEQFKALGAAGVIAKPFDPMTLAHSALAHLSQDSARAHLPQ